MKTTQHGKNGQRKKKRFLRDSIPKSFSVCLESLPIGFCGEKLNRSTMNEVQVVILLSHIPDKAENNTYTHLPRFTWTRKRKEAAPATRNPKKQA
jgi:hypothetical protein